MGKVGEGDEHVADVECCPNCKRLGRKRLIAWNKRVSHTVRRLLADDTCSMRYETFRTAGNGPPHLAVGFNSGMHERPQSWGTVLDHLYSENIPSVFTSYTLGAAR